MWRGTMRMGNNPHTLNLTKSSLAITLILNVWLTVGILKTNTEDFNQSKVMGLRNSKNISPDSASPDRVYPLNKLHNYRYDASV